MKNRIIRAAVLLAALLLQFGPAQRLRAFSFSPNLCVLAFVGVCLFCNSAEAVAVGGIYGLIIDGAAGRGFGVNLLLYMYLAVGVKLTVSEKINNSPALMAGCVWLFTALYYLAYGLLSLAVPRGDVAVGRWLLTAFAAATFNLALSLPLFWAALKLRKGGDKA